jgi:hypothetical protein
MWKFKPRTEHYSKLTPLTPGSRFAREYDVYRREVGRFLSEGREGQFVLIEGETVRSFWPTFQEGIAEGHRCGLSDPFVYQVMTEHPIMTSGYNKLCPL